MNRREAVRALGGALAVVACDAAAQTTRRRKVGYLIASRGSDFPTLHDAMRRGLHDLGYVEGRDVEILVRSADGAATRYPALVDELVRERVEVIVAANSPAALAAKAGAPTIPLVFAGVGDPVGLGLVDSLARPGGHATGIVLLTPELTPKRLALLREAVPAMQRVAVLWNPGTRGHPEELEALGRMAAGLQLTLQPVEARGPEDLDAAFDAMARARADGLVVLASPMHHRHIRRIADHALRQRLPAVCEFSEFVDAGGFMVYGPRWSDMYRHAARYVAKLLEGAKASDLPVEQPAEITLDVNADTAAALGIALPPSIVLRLDRRERSR